MCLDNDSLADDTDQTMSSNITSTPHPAVNQSMQYGWWIANSLPNNNSNESDEDLIYIPAYITTPENTTGLPEMINNTDSGLLPPTPPVENMTMNATDPSLPDSEDTSATTEVE